MSDRKLFLALTAIAGFLTLAAFSIIQRMILGLGFMTSPKAYVVPFIYGGSIGFLLGWRQLRIWRDEEKLQESVALLERQRGELATAGEMLRRQVEEYEVACCQLLAGEQQLRDKNDELTATEEMLREQIEENEESRRNLEESNRNLQALFDVSPLPMLITTYPEDLVIDGNRRFCEEFGYCGEGLVGKKSELTGLWGEQASLRSFPDLLGDLHEVSGLSAVLVNKDGAKRDVLISSRVIEYKGKRCLLSAFLDVTEHKRMEDMLRQTQKMEVIGQLAGGVAHDFNNMLTAIIGSADLLSDHVVGNPRASALVSTITEAAARSADLTRQLLAFSRKGKKELVPMCINEAVRGVMTMLERTIDKSIVLRTELASSNSVVAGDETLLKNALLNLGINARDAMPEGGVLTLATADVCLDAEMKGACGSRIPAGKYVEIRISDTGTGMKREVLERIFEPFFTTKEAGKGTGLGLPAVYGTIRDHRGGVTIESEPGAGTSFRLYLPVSVLRGGKAEEEESVFTGSGGILLVDDEALLRNSGQGMLEDLGYRVFLAVDGEQAIEVYAKERDAISLVILDMVMPKLGGEKTLLEFRSRYPEAKVLLSSGKEWTVALGDYHVYGARGFIRKPYRKQELCRAIAAALEMSGVGCESGDAAESGGAGAVEPAPPGAASTASDTP